jgi:hypothetical protein
MTALEQTKAQAGAAGEGYPVSGTNLRSGEVIDAVAGHFEHDVHFLS